MPIDLEHQRKRAKDLRRAHARGERDAAARIAAHHPRFAGRAVEDVLAARFALSDAQLVIAREAGFASWPMLVHAIAPDPELEALLDAAIAGDDTVVRQLAPQVTRTPHLAAALGEPFAIGDAVDERAGRRAWTPLLYACCARHGQRDPSVRAGRVAIARSLLAAGADVNARGREGGFGSANVDGFDVETWSPLAGAAGRVGSAELMQVLIDAGADPERAEQLLKLAVWSGDLRVLETAIAARPPWWQVIWALVACADLDLPVQAAVLVPHAASVKSLEPALVRALREERSLALFEILLGDGAMTPERRAIEDTVYRAARRYRRAEAAARLRQRGASDTTLSREDLAIAGEALEGPFDFTDEDHRMLAWAIAKGHDDLVPHLLAIGLDPGVHDETGKLPIHHARTRETIDRLVAAGARADAKSFDDECAASAELFERAADAVAAGDIATLRELLDDEPDLVRARSPRSHRCTLLHYTGANGTESERQRSPANSAEIAELLLARGADPDATCKLYGGGATTLGLMLTSVHPPAAGVDGDMIRVLAKHGARIPERAIEGAIQYALPRSIAALVEAGAPMTLLVAAALDRVELVDQLLATTDVNARFSDNYTALHAAAGLGHRRMVEHLLARGADPALRDARWEGTPADKARHFGHTALADLIDASRASPSAT
jgi:ankyrin repeat protein